MSYNGWSNYETWCVHLWLSNEEGSYYAAREAVERRWDSAKPWRAAQDLKDFVESECIPDLGATMASDLLTAALSEVDWEEVAQAFAPEQEEVAD